MKFFGLLLAAVGAVASIISSPVFERATIERRDLDTITTAFNNISSNNMMLDQAVLAFNKTNATTILALNTASVGVLDAIMAAITNIKPTGAISQDDSLTLGAVVGNFNVNTNKTITDLIKAKAVFVSTGIGSLVYTNLIQTRNASLMLTTVVESKNPANVQALGYQLSAPIIGALNQGIAAYQDQAPPGTNTTAATASGLPTATAAAGAMPTGAISYGVAGLAALVFAAAL